MLIMPFKSFLNPYTLCFVLGIFLSPYTGFASPDTDSLQHLVEPEITQATQRFYPELSFDYAFDLDALNPYRFDVSTLQDTFLLVMADSQCGFSFPHWGKVNSTFGWRKGRVHSGIDLQLEWGDTIRGAFDGVVRVSQFHKGYGNFIIIRHYNGLETLYAHLQSRFVVHGDAVSAGQIIGQGGSTGRSTGAHLHFETRFLGRPIDPETFIDFDARCLKSEVASVHAGSFDIPQTKKSQRMF
jgi:murein DD-endopeptidase MepM/ murein hydrolase activator NlpD